MLLDEQRFEERLYNVSQWITTDIASTKDRDIQDGFWKLYYFMHRENKEGKHNYEIKSWKMLAIKHYFKACSVCFVGKTIVMTRPVVVSVNEAVENGGSRVSISFFISQDTDLPEPNDETIKVKDLPAATVYVR